MAAVALVLADSGSALRPAVVFLFLLIGPGMAFVTLLDVESAWTELTLGLATSLALDTLVAGVMVEAKLWSTSGGVLALGVMTLLGASVCIGTSRPRRAGRPLRTTMIPHDRRSYGARA